MPLPSTAPAHFLGLELSTEQLRATIIDDELNVVGVESVDFDTELPEYQTRGGVFTTPGDAYTTPVEMWVKALDMLLEKLRRRCDLSKIKSIGGCAQHATVWWTPESATFLSNLSPNSTLSSQLPSSATFSLQYTPVFQDTSTLAQSLSLEPLNIPSPSGTAAQAMKIREGNPDAWAQTGRVMLASAFLSSTLLGRWAPMSLSEVVGTGLWNEAREDWDDRVLEVVGGSPEEGARLRTMLGTVEQTPSTKIGTISPFLVERFGFDRDAFLVPFTSDHLSTYLSICPSPTDAILSFGSTDVLLTPAPHYIPGKLYSLFPHPAQDPSEKRKYVAMLMNRNADVPRALVRDMYTKSWSAFDRLVAVIPPGGSIGLDDKLFSFWVLQGESYPFSHVKGIFRFETGVKVNEFRDLRANPRCLLESQILSFRVRYARMASNGLFYPRVPSSTFKKLQQNQNHTPSHMRGMLAHSLGISFDPYDSSRLPKRIIAVGTAANFPSVVGLLADVFDAPIFVPASPSPSPFTSPDGRLTPGGGNNAPSPSPGGLGSTSNIPLLPTPSRPSACIGGAYLARWAWRRSVRPDEKYATFEDEIRHLLKKKWSGLALPVSTSGPLDAFSPVGRSVSSSYLRSALASTTFKEEDEDEVNAASSAGDGGAGFDALGFTNGLNNNGISNGAARTTTSSSAGNQTSSPIVPTISTSGTNGAAGGNTNNSTPPPLSAAPTTITLSALPTEETEIQLGLVKVAESDTDSFMTYAAIVPEYCRLEGMLVKALV